MRAPFALLTLLCSGCLAFIGPDDPRDVRDLVAARARWNVHGSSHYVLEGSPRCFCVAGGLVARVTVTGGQVTSVSRADTGEMLPTHAWQSFRTVEDLFDLIDDAIKRDAHRIDVTYDPEQGFPTTLYIDYSDAMADEEYGFNVLRVQIQ